MTAARTLRRTAVPAAPLRVPAAWRRRYADLYDEPVRPTPDGGAVFHRARLWRRGGVCVLHLRGDRFEMAFQHGRLLRDEIACGTLQAAARVCRNAVRASVGEPLATVVSAYADLAIAERMLRRGLERARDRGDDALAEAYGLSEGAGVPMATLLRAALAPECAQTLLGKATDLAIGSDPAQCTSFAAWGDATAGGELLVGRNTDYPLTGYFDAHPTVIYFEPTDGGQRYVSITSAGVHNAGTVGFNEAGLYLACHTVPCATTSETGLPLFFVGQQVLRDATSLADAERMLHAERPAAGWSYHAVDMRRRQAATFELCWAAAATRRATGSYHVTTNHWTQDATRAHELDLNETVSADTRARYDRVVALIEAAGGALDVAGAIAILGDKVDPVSGRVRSTPNVVSASHNVTSAVLAPDRGRMFVARGPAPVSQNAYVELPMLDAFDPDALADAPVVTLAGGIDRGTHGALVDAERLYNEARAAFEYRDDADAAARLCRRAIALDPDNPALRVALALWEVRAGRYDAAERAAASARAHTWDGPRARLARYLCGRLAAHRGAADDALADLRAVAADPDVHPRLAAAAREAADAVARRGRLRLGRREIAPMSWLPDAFRYRGVLPAAVRERL
ncbi:MAG: hypothetical protein D6689_06655 [Deltaproteobacteria bacterium]|nr:MAG: hypothetical protein D6689_06655 [Deltaproteobacteria bacterium]